MTPLPYQEVLEAYANPFHELEIEPLTTGLINQSYKVSSKHSGESFLLQQINSKIFRDPAIVQSNYEKLWQHLDQKEHGRCIPAPKYFPGDISLFCDSHERYWRVFEFIEGTKSFDIAADPAIAMEVANVFAKFTTCFADFDPTLLTPTIPDFHNLALRYTQFENALHSRNLARLTKAATLINDLRSRNRYVHFYEVLTDSEEFPKRVMHHDAKISNILFDISTNEVICPVDLDTVMPGHIFSDLGDMIRSMSSCKDENSTDLESLCIRDDFYKAILEGYMARMGEYMTVAEKKYIHYSGLFMIYMQSLRFITDYLNGDLYYKTNYREQNFDRALNQWVLLTRLEEFLATAHGFPVQEKNRQ